MTNKYEVALVLSVANGDEAVNALKEKFNDLIAKNGTVENVDEWGKRRLAYPINDETEGYYIFTTMTSEPALPAELERIAGITEGILRIMVIRK
ncbi:MAG: 30S ribosomal protein S6 [Clostridia bacterium]|nr:30S ribosomal protein S6 [Clostridia bacterium]